MTATMLQCLKNSRRDEKGAVLGYMVTESSPKNALLAKDSSSSSAAGSLRVLEMRLKSVRKPAHKPGPCQNGLSRHKHLLAIK